ncbi:MAG: bacteriohemerythrin [Spirochaetota bacterium]
MEKIKVSSGIYWVGIPEANLYVLCGCPADSVKHMIKRGLIVQKEKKGVIFETGPNAILLSDVLVQNERLCNLAEFPVLQMFYRQGMLIPNHPNNTGQKPLLIGVEDQVRAQGEYIFYGNYGLPSEEDIIKTGIPGDYARKIMRIKLRFAFDRIQKTQELVDFRIIDKDAVELRNGVYILRKGLNLYEFCYRGESVTVDLNLSKEESYEPPYNLGHHRIRRDYFSIIHTGEGDGWDMNRPCMGSILVFQGKVYLIDAGPNIDHSLTALGISVNEIEGIFHTHAHDDHFAGLTTLLRSDHLIKYYSTPLVRASVFRKLSALMGISEETLQSYFEIHDLEINQWNKLGGLEVKPVFSPHPIETTIMFFRTFWEGGYRTYAHLADIASLKVLRGMITDDDRKSGISREFFNEIKDIYRSPVDVKKIDIGGGLIHGMAEDFLGDHSSKIYLSHTSLKLTKAEKEIGSNAIFGMQDTLIQAQQDYTMQSAYYYIQSYFSSLPQYELNLMMNCPVESFNPGIIITRKGQKISSIFLILTGEVEFVDAERGIRSTLSAGSLMHEFAGLHGYTPQGTYRSIGYVKLLRISSDLYREIVKRNNFYSEVEQLHKAMGFLQITWLFGEMISGNIQNRIARSLTSRVYKKDTIISSDGPMQLYMLASGELRIYAGERVVETLKNEGFFGEERFITGSSNLFTAWVSKGSCIYMIPAKAIHDIPVVQWKLLEVFKRRIKIFSKSLLFEWQDDYSVYTEKLDVQHSKLFGMINKLRQSILGEGKKSTLEGLMNEIAGVFKEHFRDEEDYMKKIDFTALKSHRREHERLMEKIESFRKKIRTDGEKLRMEFFEFLKYTLLRHILIEDKKYAEQESLKKSS